MTESDFKFVRDAVIQIANHGWKLLPLYWFNGLTGNYQHREFDASQELDSIADLFLTKNRRQSAESRMPSSRMPSFRLLASKATKQRRATMMQDPLTQRAVADRNVYLKVALEWYGKAAAMAERHASAILAADGNYACGCSQPHDVAEFYKFFYAMPSDAVTRFRSQVISRGSQMGAASEPKIGKCPRTVESAAGPALIKP